MSAPKIKYGVQPADGSDVWVFPMRKFAEDRAPSIPGGVVYKVDDGPWQRAADIAVVDRADVAALLAAIKAFHAVGGVDEVMLEAQQGIVERLERAINPGGTTP